MATTPIQFHPLFTFSFSTATDFTDLAEHSAHFGEMLIETDDPVQKMALCGRLHTSLMLLEAKLADPVPPHLIEQLTADTLPDDTSRPFRDCNDLCSYCIALTQTLSGLGFTSKATFHLSWLLYELTRNLNTEIRAPRWLRTDTPGTFSGQNTGEI